MTSRAGNYFHAQATESQARLDGVPLASFRSRALAFLIDGIIVSLLVLAPDLWAAFVARKPATVTLTLDFGTLIAVAVVVLYFGLATYFGKGSTIGKRVLGIRVVSLVHDEISLWQSIERALGYAASSLEAGFGFLQYFTHPNRQTVHDRIAETVVIVDRRPGGETVES
jgi:uncharacterized RDD family membrane protein YckC